MQTFFRNSLIRQCSAILFVLTLIAPATLRAQGVKARSGDASVNIGVNNVNIVENKAHVEFGFSGGYNFIKQLALSGEFSYLPQSAGNVNLNITTYGLNLRYSPWTAPFKTKRVVPFFVLDEGYAHFGSTGGSLNGSYGGIGIGTSLYLTPNFGIRPEVHSDALGYQPANNQNVYVYTDYARFMLAAFYQWGGRK